MARHLFRWDGEKMVEITEAPVTPRLEVITDSMPVGGLKHPCTGTYIESKSRFRQITRAAGCIEVGNEKQVDRRDWGVKNLKEDIRASIDVLQSRR